VLSFCSVDSPTVPWPGSQVHCTSPMTAEQLLKNMSLKIPSPCPPGFVPPAATALLRTAPPGITSLPSTSTLRIRHRSCPKTRIGWRRQPDESYLGLWEAISMPFLRSLKNESAAGQAGCSDFDYPCALSEPPLPGPCRSVSGARTLASRTSRSTFRKPNRFESIYPINQTNSISTLWN
jgi:hypothetical protein